MSRTHPASASSSSCPSTSASASRPAGPVGAGADAPCKIGDYHFKLFPRMLGRWNGEAQVVNPLTGKVLPVVWYLKVWEPEDQPGHPHLRLITTTSDAVSRKQAFALEPVADGRFRVRALYDETLLKSKLELRELLTSDSDGVLTLTATGPGPDAGVSQMHVFRLSTAPHGAARCAQSAAALSYTIQYFSPEGALVCVEAAVLRPCRPDQPVPYVLDVYEPPKAAFVEDVTPASVEDVTDRQAGHGVARDQ